jgi:hypothetical protein
MPRRPIHVHAEIPLKRSLSGDGAPLRAELIVSLVKYLLFVRRQLPKQYDELKAELTLPEAPAKPGSTMAARRRARCMEAAEQTFAAVRELALAEPPEIAAVVLGHSPTLPKEVYVLRFAAVAERLIPDAQLDAAAAHDATRRLLRRLVTQVESQFEGVKRPMNTWVFVHQSARAVSAALALGERQQAEGAPPAFAPKPGFRVALNKSCHVVTIDIGSQECFEPNIECWPGVAVVSSRPSAQPRAGMRSAFDEDEAPLAGDAGTDGGSAEEGRDGMESAPAPTPPPAAAAAPSSDAQSSPAPAADADVEPLARDELPRLGEDPTPVGLWLQCAYMIAGFQPLSA